jgi:TonB family protein
MPQPEPQGAPLPRDQKSPGAVRDAVSTQHPSVTEVARTLAAHGGGAASFDLALDLVLNEVVEQARLVTGATGAAIALARAGEMVCRATTGGDAPDLGVRLETTSGLSGACLQTGTIQKCVDAENDSRVNTAASRRLGVRSILVLPLGEEKEPFGILEVFSSRPNAFGDRDINTLQVLARRVAENKKGAEEISVGLSSGGHRSHSSTEVNPTVDERVSRSDVSDLLEEQSPKQNEVLPAVLSVLVIVTAVLLGVALGWRAGSGRGTRRAGQPPVEVVLPTKSSLVPDSATEKTSAPLGASTTSQTGNLSSPAEVRRAVTPADPPLGGLQVTQNGKVIYRLPPVEQAASTGKSTTPEASEETSATRLIHRVEPEYPPEARAQHIQGEVKLDVQVGGEGAVQNIQVVEGDPLLAGAAVQAVRQWRYRPYSVNGRAVEMQTRITIRFTLPQN